MRAVAWVLLVPYLVGCSTTVQRLHDEVPTPAGTPDTMCERDSWFELHLTRYEKPKAEGRITVKRDDGIGLYRVGGKTPVSIPAAADSLRPSPLLAPHEERVSSYDRKRVMGSVLGAAGLVTLAVGAVMFATSFESTRRNGDEINRINTTKGTWSGIVVGLGFGLGITGLVINPGYADRARADAARYVFVPPGESEEEVVALVERHNERVRAACQRAK
jgi:hypothetical protein